MIRIQTSGGEIIGILKKIKDTDPADSHHAPDVEGAPEEQNGRDQEQVVDVEVICRVDLQGSDLGNGFQLALCNVSWLATRESVVLSARSHRLRAVVRAVQPRRAL